MIKLLFLFYQSALNQSDLNVLFETLLFGSEETIETCCSVISLVAKHLEPVQLHTRLVKYGKRFSINLVDNITNLRYANQINVCLVKGSPPAKKCVLEILTDAISSPSCEEFLQNERYWVTRFTQLGVINVIVFSNPTDVKPLASNVNIHWKISRNVLTLIV